MLSLPFRIALKWPAQSSSACRFTSVSFYMPSFGLKQDSFLNLIRKIWMPIKLLYVCLYVKYVIRKIGYGMDRWHYIDSRVFSGFC